jgi:hypothetical protein
VAEPRVSATALRVGYLVWAPLGTGSLRRFAASYDAHDAGAEHALVVIYNGFRGERDPRLADCRRELDGIAHEQLVLGDPALDLAAYVGAVRAHEPARWCLLNSYSEILAAGWLGHLARALDSPGAGLVGASGSWGSMRSYVRFQFGLGGPYAATFADRRATNAILAGFDAANTPAARPGFIARRLHTLRATVDQTRGFAGFPAVHVRSTGFMLDAATLDLLRVPSLRSKVATYRFESGAASMTAQIERAGLSALVVDRDGNTYQRADWAASATFWQGRQERLLIADKQTAHYEQADLAGRAVLSGFAWGRARDPLPD